MYSSSTEDRGTYFVKAQTQKVIRWRLDAENLEKRSSRYLESTISSASKHVLSDWK